MNKTPFLRRLHNVAPRKAGNPNKPSCAGARLAMRRGARCKPVSFYDSRMGTAPHILTGRLRYFVAKGDRNKPETLAREEATARRMGCEMSRRAWWSRTAPRRPVAWTTWRRRWEGWRAGPGLLPWYMRPDFPRYGRFYLSTMRADAAPMRRKGA